MKKNKLFEDGVDLSCYSPESASEANILSREWMDEFKEVVLSEVKLNGGILLRGFNVLNRQDYKTLIEGFGINLHKYIGGNNPRSEVLEKVYESTSYPPDWEISLHSEMSHLSHYPDFISFFCERAPAKNHGGRTPVASNIRILELMPKDLVSRMKETGLRYVQRMPKKSGSMSFGRVWSEVFQNTDKGQIEKFIESHGNRYEWGNDESLMVSFFQSATKTHPERKCEVWFNQAEQWHHTNLKPEVVSFIQKRFGDQGFPHHSGYANGSEFEIEELSQIRAIYKSEARYFDWQQNDVLILDNLLMSHGRESYKGERSILVAMGNRSA